MLKLRSRVTLRDGTTGVVIERSRSATGRVRHALGCVGRGSGENLPSPAPKATKCLCGKPAPSPGEACSAACAERAAGAFAELVRLPPKLVRPFWWHGEPPSEADVMVARGFRRVALPRGDGGGALFSEREDKRSDGRRGNTGDLQHMGVYRDIVRPVVLRTGLYPSEHEERARIDREWADEDTPWRPVGPVTRRTM